MRESFLHRRDMALEVLSKIDGLKVNVPEGAFYVFPDVTGLFGKSDGTFTINSATDVSMYLLEKARVALVTGSAFGDPNCIRISYAASEEVLQEALKRIAAAISELK